MALDRDIRDLVAGRITKEEYNARINARGVGALIGLGLAGLGTGGVALGEALMPYMLSTAPTAVPIIGGLVEGLVPGPPGSLTIAAGSRLTETEIGTGFVWQRKQAWH